MNPQLVVTGRNLNLSESTRRRNPHLFGQENVQPIDQTNPDAPKTRVNQRRSKKMNQLEAEFYATIRDRYHNYPPVRAQAKTYVLANGVRYTPDFTCSSWPSPTGQVREAAWEVKGKHAWDDAMVKLKVAASAWPEVQWFLVWKDQTGKWMTQEILP